METITKNGALRRLEKSYQQLGARCGAESAIRFTNKSLKICKFVGLL